MTLASRRDRDRDLQGRDIFVLTEEAAARRASGDYKDVRREQVAKKMITGEPGACNETMTIEAVSMTADQFNELTRFRLDQVWPEYSGRAMTEVTMTIDQLQMLVVALHKRHRMDIEATREGETVPKLDQVDQVDIGATREGRPYLSWTRWTRRTSRRPGRGRPYSGWTR